MYENHNGCVLPDQQQNHRLQGDKDTIPATTGPIIPHRLNITQDELAAFCNRWLIAELALFGSVIRDDFRDDSDIDMLVTFKPEARWSLLDHCRMDMELEEIVQRKVDTATKQGVEQSRNDIIRNEILRTAQVIYEA